MAKDQTSQPKSADIQPFFDNAIPVIPVDNIIHSSQTPFCDDPSCYCHENEDNINMVDGAFQDGIITANEASDIVGGKKPW
jgi:hypothetical protein